MLSVVDAMKATSGFVRPMREGEEVLNAGLVISVGKREEKESVVHVQALVLRTSGLTSEHPYSVDLWIDLSKDYGDRLSRDQSLECGCPAGSSEKCKHVVAVMLYLCRVECQDLDVLSCTDVQQQWGKLKKATLREYEAQKISELCHVREQKNIYVSSLAPVTREMEDRWRNRLMKCAPGSEISMFYSGIRVGEGLSSCTSQSSSSASQDCHIISSLLSNPPFEVLSNVEALTQRKLQSVDAVLLKFYEQNVTVTQDQVASLLATPQRTAAWFSGRNMSIPASKAYSQFTYAVNPKANWEKRYADLYHSKFNGNKYTDRGNILETVARKRYEELEGCQVVGSGLLVRPEIPWVRASLDGTALVDGRLVRNVEIKTIKDGETLTAAVILDQRRVKTLDNNVNLKKNTDHFAQVQIGMALSGILECDYIVYSQAGNDYLKVRVPFDSDYVFNLLSRLCDVYFDHFLPLMMEDFYDNS